MVKNSKASTGIYSSALYKYKPVIALPRIKALRELLEDLTPEHKVIIWAVFKNNYTQIKALCEKLRINYVEVHGGISEKKKHEAITAFDKDDKTRVYIGHPGAGGIGAIVWQPLDTGIHAHTRHTVTYVAEPWWAV